MTHADRALARGRSRDGNGAQPLTAAAVPEDHTNCPGIYPWRRTADVTCWHCPGCGHSWTVPVPRRSRHGDDDGLDNLDLTGLL